MSRGSRFTHQPRREWYPVSLSASLGREPKKFLVLGTPYVLYRGLSGAPVAQLDRCPHRNVPLSSGRCLPDDTIECPYHGWRFGPDGECSAIPARLGEPKKSHRVETFSCREESGIVWLCPEQSVLPHYAPLSVPESKSADYSVLLRQVSFPGGLHAVVENALDVPHTSILHRGLFRGETRNRVQVTMRRYREGAEAHYEGEPAPRGLIARLLSLGAESELTVQHYDRFILPNVLQVEYRLGKGTHFLVTGYCCPSEEGRTELFALVCIRTPFPKWMEKLLLFAIEPLAMKVVRQDVEVLSQQRDTLQTFGEEKFMSTEVDILGGAVTRLLKESFERELRGEFFEEEGAQIRRLAEEEPRELTQIEIDA